jgi:hypothetical protein
VVAADPNAPDYSALPLADTTTDPTKPGVQGIYSTDLISCPANFQYLNVTINSRDDVILNTAWTFFPNGGLPLATSATSPRMPMQFWLTLKYNNTVSGDASMPATGEVFEIALVYKWQQPGQSGWDTGTVRAVVPNPNPAIIRQ